MVNNWRKRFIAGGLSILLLTYGQTAFAESEPTLMEEFEQAQQSRDAALEQARNHFQQMVMSGEISNAAADRINLMFEYSLQESQVQGARSVNDLIMTLVQNPPSNGEQDINEFMALFQQMAQEMRNTARADRQAEMQAQTDALKQAADQMRQSAQERMMNGITQDVSQFTQGSMQIGGAMSRNIQPPQPSRGIDRSRFGDLAGQPMPSGLPSAYTEADNKRGDADRSEMDAAEAAAATQHANDMMQQMMDIIRDVREKLGQIQQAEIETNRGIARNI